jgi:hypothetical protein
VGQSVRVSEGVDRTRQWRSLVSAFRTAVPEIDAWWTGSDGAIEDASPTEAWFALCFRLQGGDYAPTPDYLDVWKRVLAFIEVVEEALDIVDGREGPKSEDAITLYAFANAGILCEVGWNRSGLATLLPFMGPRTASAARHEAVHHDRIHRNWAGLDVDWSTAGSSFHPLDIRPNDIIRPDLGRP